MNAAVWMGSAVFLVFAAEPASDSSSLLNLIGRTNFPYFSVAIGHLFSVRYAWLHVICGAIALLHAGAEWLYLGRQPTRLWLGLIAALFLAGVTDLSWLQPKLGELHRLQYARRDLRESAARSYAFWWRFTQALHLASVAGLSIYLWRIANPPDTARFVSANKFRS